MSDDRFLSPKLLQGVGILLLVAFAVFWALTDRQSTLLVGSAASLILLGRYERVGEVLKEQLRRASREEDKP